jgi:hypothetical protein
MSVAFMLVASRFQFFDTMLDFMCRLIGASEEFTCLVDQPGRFQVFRGGTHVFDSSLHLRDFAMRIVRMRFVVGAFTVVRSLRMTFAVLMQFPFDRGNRLSHHVDFTAGPVQQFLISFALGVFGAFHRFGKLGSDLMHSLFKSLVDPLPLELLPLAMEFGVLGPFARLHLTSL